MQNEKSTTADRPELQSAVLVVGLGISGYWTASWLAGQGARVTVSETKEESELDPDILRELLELGVRVEAGGHKKETFLSADTIVISPGVPHYMDLIVSASKRGIPVLGELELAGRYVNKPIIAVTGTNGKSTVTTLIGLMLRNAGFKVFVGGNIGTPLITHLAEEEETDYLVVEASSFQLDTIDTFCPAVSIILNISPDHLDRYPGYEAYVQSKLRVLRNQGKGQFAILNHDDQRLVRVNPPSGVSLLRYGIEKRAGLNAFVEGGAIRVRLDQMKSLNFSIDAFSLPGTHNMENLLGTVLAGATLGIDSSAIQKTIDEFKGLPNRLEHVGELNGVRFYNDSKATNVDAAVRAVTSLERPLILIAGGRHKGADYAPLVEAARGRVKEAIFLGEAKELLGEAFGGHLRFSLAGDMEEAVSAASSMAQPGDSVLLAPACSSFDMFSDYSQRGEAFRSAVKELVRG